MTRDEVRAAKRVAAWHERFAPLFGRKEAQEHSQVYLKGLLSNQKRRERRAPLLCSLLAERRVLRQRKRGGGPARIHYLLAVEGGQRVSRDSSSFCRGAGADGRAGLGTVGVIDELGFVKAGNDSVGVARQWCGRLGKSANCQVGVFLVGVTPGGTAFLDAQLFLTEERIARQGARQDPRSQEVKFQTKPEIAAEMIRRTLAAGKVHFDWITADELYGSSGDFLDALEEMQQRYVVEVKKNTIVFSVDPATLPGAFPAPRRGRSLAATGTRRRSRWRRWRRHCPLRPGNRSSCGKGPRVHWCTKFAAVRVWAMRHYKPGSPLWLLLRRTDGEDRPEVLRFQRERADAVARPWLWRAGRGGAWKNAWKTGRRTWGWRTTKRDPGTVGTITWRWWPWRICA